MQYDEATYDRIEGTLLGVAVGDALGAPYEFQIPGPNTPKMIGGGIGPWEPGEWTDDTQTTICVARAAIEAELEPVAVGRRLLTWYATEPKDVGHQTRLVLQAATAESMTECAAELYAQRPRASAGNGSLMRTAPVALAHLGDDAALATTARAISDLTHGDPVCGDACVLWCVAIDRAIREQRLDGIDDGIALLPHRARRRWIEWIDQARRDPPATFVPNGYVVTALQAAVAAIGSVTTTVPAEAFRQALTASIAIGHDTDTVGAIAGALLGARWGRSAIPAAWMAPLHGWPDLDADSLAVLARRLIASAE